MAGVSAAGSVLELDAQLMVRLREGDVCGFELLLAKYRQPIVHFLYRMVQNAGVAEELAQEVFLRVYCSRARYQPSAKFTTWLYRIAANLALNWLRDERRRACADSLDAAGRWGAAPQWPDQQNSIEQRLVRKTVLAAVRQAVAALPDRQRAVVLLHKYHGLDYDQIALTLGCSVSAVKSLTFRAYANLRKALAGSLAPLGHAVQPKSAQGDHRGFAGIRADSSDQHSEAFQSGKGCA